MIDINDEERQFLGFHLACQLEDYEKSIKKNCKDAESRQRATKQLQRLEKLIYTKIIPEAWCGPHPKYWEDV